jgi:hypothetical protein
MFREFVMRKFVLPVVAVLVGIFAIALTAAPASAQATRTYVSGVGDDANPCSRTAPCKTFAGAISKTAAKGEIDCLDPGGFGTLTITKAITLDCGYGQVGSILASPSVFGINVNAGASDVVIIRNLNINGAGGTTGISFNTGGSLIVQRCSIFGFAGNGVLVASTNNSKTVIADTHFTNNATGTGNAAVLVRPTAGAAASVSINNSYMENQINGVFVDGSGGGGAMHVQVRDSVITSSTNNGVTVSGASASAEVINSLISYSVNTGASVGAGTLKIGGNAITDNVLGVSSGVLSYKNNMISDNTTDGTPVSAVPGYSGTGQ